MIGIEAENEARHIVGAIVRDHFRIDEVFLLENISSIIDEGSVGKLNAACIISHDSQRMGVLEIKLHAPARLFSNRIDDFTGAFLPMNGVRQLLAIIEGGNSIRHQKDGVARLKLI